MHTYWPPGRWACPRTLRSQARRSGATQCGRGGGPRRSGSLPASPEACSRRRIDLFLYMCMHACMYVCTCNTWDLNNMAHCTIYVRMYECMYGVCMYICMYVCTAYFRLLKCCSAHHVRHGAAQSSSRRLCSWRLLYYPVTADTFQHVHPAPLDAMGCGGAEFIRAYTIIVRNKSTKYTNLNRIHVW